MLEELERGHEAYRRRAWADAYEALSLADHAARLLPQDLELLANAAQLAGHELEALGALERAYHGYLEGEQPSRAARCGFWLGLFLLLRDDVGQATAWLSRAQRLVESEPNDCVERGYLLMPLAEQQLIASDWQGAQATATRALEIAERCGDADLIGCARHIQGRALLAQGEIKRGLGLLDEAMLAAVAGELSPVLTGMIYCSVIDACLRIYAFPRASEWTAALARWCQEQPQLVAFTGTCVVHRAEIMQLNGGWQSALAEVRGACERFSRGVGQRPPAAAFYQRGEVERLRGELEAAEDAYTQASELGCEPQPGLALLRLAQGRSEPALAALRRLINAATDPLQRTRYLPAYVEVLLARAELEEARRAADELGAIAESFPIEALAATANQSRAAVALSQGDAAGALVLARRAWQTWERIEAPYLAARARELVGLACSALGDHDGHRLELQAAKAAFERLGAQPDLLRIVAPGAAAQAIASPLTARELEVLRLVAAGKTNKAIGRELHVSGKTVERHVSNILAKLEVPSRAAATAYAFTHKLV